jgi:hypothetical protein
MRLLTVLAVALMMAWPVLAQEAAVSAPAASAQTTIVAPDGALVEFTIDATLHSRHSKAGDKFVITLTAPLIVDGEPVIPAGATGEGEVTHAARSGLGGRPGELLLAARYIDTPDGRVRLRGFQFGAVGRDRSGESIYLGAAASGIAAAAGSMAPVGVIGILISGGEIEVPAGTTATAKLYGEFAFTTQPATPPAP